MKRRCVYILALLMLLTGCGPRLTESREKTLRENSGTVRIGMTRQEIQALLGKPDYYLPKRDPTRLLYLDHDMEQADSWEYIDPDSGGEQAKKIHFDPKTGRAVKIERVNSG